MSLNIKNERVHELARRAAKCTGRTQTGAIELALERLLAEYEDATERRLRVINEAVAKADALITDEERADPDFLSTDVLYDENGLYR
ncbi:type II toxin-antitoxin system VapB family antitoxin [Dietzia sp. 179-F 9C3 NHS]|uniref:type II toxin-antitoxin system VapB family antitoxin n=1 Tax=Dietzia sp. 179-F 9C3 NHS TaxID=3374295 RepID=UPI00387A1757